MGERGDALWQAPAGRSSFSPLAHRGARDISTDTLRISLILRVSSGGAIPNKADRELSRAAFGMSDRLSRIERERVRAIGAAERTAMGQFGEEAERLVQHSGTQ